MYADPTLARVLQPEEGEASENSTTHTHRFALMRSVLLKSVWCICQYSSDIRIGRPFKQSFIPGDEAQNIPFLPSSPVHRNHERCCQRLPCVSEMRSKEP